LNLIDYELGGVPINKILLVLIIALAAAVIGKSISLYFTRLMKKRMTRDHIKIITKAFYFLIFFIAAIIVLPIVGINASSLIVAGGIFAIVIGFATQTIFGNLVSGLFLIFERPIKVGDVVNIDSTIGQVEDIRVISTTIRTFDGYFVRIPNMTVFNSKITNFFVNKARRFEYSVGIRYKDDADKAIQIIKETIEEHPFALKYPEPMVFVEQLGNSSVDITVKIWAPFSEWYEVRRELLWKIKVNLEENGIFVPFPQREVWFNSELVTSRKEDA
jgi:small-conductance mechanosensitive channel